MQEGEPSVALAASLTPVDLFLRRIFHASRRSAFEFSLVFCVFYFATPSVSSLVMGAVVTLFGELLRVWSAGYGYKAGELTLQGPYRFVRHPYFLGSALFFLGFCVAGRHAGVTTFGLVGLILVYRRFVVRDEQRWQKTLGPYFDQYRSSVSPFTPQLLPGKVQEKAPGNKKFSFETAIFRGRHRELDAILGIALGYGLLYLSFRFSWYEYHHIVVLTAALLFLLGRVVYYRMARAPT